MSRQLTFPRPPIVVSSSLRRDRRGNFDGPYCCGCQSLIGSKVSLAGAMNQIIYLIGLIVVIMLILSFFGLR